ncbi:hypothetical protein [Sediminicoccus sp. KRV36]|uniref:hypothetical protein n=1 Tax=Sediminicoccus sp. KRV36 TaxID=3133721 RepID=UPI00200BAF0E|nr:hypothetical protein [Sediminicoccus rosea]UPY37788.1 hypothetical protein LHU95_03575 [Sediminicoccus rosea]
MPSTPLMAARSAQLATGLFLLLAAPAQAVEYDGNWQFAMSCSANGAQPAFTERFIAPIAQNAVTRTRSGRTAQGQDDTSRFSARIEGGQMTAVVDRNRGGERWSIRFAGPATSDRRFDLAGGIFLGERQLRSCQLVAEALSSAPGSLAATAPARAEAARQQLAAAQAALAALQANSEAEAQALRTDVDLARFEGAAMRAELDQRVAAIALLETRLRTAEGATAQAQAALAQAIATATAEIGQRDQRIAAAAQAMTAQRTALEARVAAAEAAAATQRTALEARITAAEAATAQATAAAATERTALQARITAAEAAAAQASATAATERSALQARITAAEAAAAQLRTALQTAQRELTEARAAQPPR